MAALRHLLIVSVLLCLAAVSAVNIVASDKSDKLGAVLVRRESTQVDLDPAGHVHSMASDQEKKFKMTTMLHEQRLKKLRRNQGAEPTECDRQFLLMAEGVDTCTGTGHPEEILYEGDCTHASTVLNIDKASNYFLNNYLVNPLPYPKGCFLNTTTNKIHFNPEESNTTGVTLTGRKLCMRNKYINGTKDSNPDSGCSGDAISVLNYDDCWAAALCSAGGGACKLQTFRDNVTTYQQDDRPKGCFKDMLGCWGFNYIQNTPTGAINGTPVCLNVVPDGAALAGGDAAAAAPAAADAF